MAKKSVIPGRVWKKRHADHTMCPSVYRGCSSWGLKEGTPNPAILRERNRLGVLLGLVPTTESMPSYAGFKPGPNCVSSFDHCEFYGTDRGGYVFICSNYPGYGLYAYRDIPVPEICGMRSWNELYWRMTHDIPSPLAAAISMSYIALYLDRDDLLRSSETACGYLARLYEEGELYEQGGRKIVPVAKKGRGKAQAGH